MRKESNKTFNFKKQIRAKDAKIKELNKEMCKLNCYREKQNELIKERDILINKSVKAINIQKSTIRTQEKTIKLSEENNNMLNELFSMKEKEATKFKNGLSLPEEIINDNNNMILEQRKKITELKNVIKEKNVSLYTIFLLIIIASTLLLFI